MATPAAVHNPGVLSNGALCELLAHYETEERALSQERRSLHQLIDQLPANDADVAPERVELVARERDLSARRHELHREINDLRAERHRRIAGLRTPLALIA